MAVLRMLKWVVVLGLVVCPGIALADPATLVVLASQAVIALGGYTGLAALAITVGTALVVGTYQAEKAKRKAAAAYNASLQDRLIMQALTDGPRSRIYGRVRNVDGVIFKVAHGTNNETYTLLVAFAGHEIDAFETIYFDDLPIMLDVNGYVLTPPYNKIAPATASEGFTLAGGAFSVTLAHPPTAASAAFSWETGTAEAPAIASVVLTIAGNTVSGFIDSAAVGVDPSVVGTLTVQYQWQQSTSKARIRLSTGGSQTAALISQLKSDLDADGISLLTSNDRFDGIAMARVDLTYDPDAFPSGVPSVSAVMRGAKVYDARTSITAWSENPALCARDWALYAHGGALPADVIDEASFSAAANACDISTTFAFPGRPSVTAPLFTCGMVCKTDTDPWSSFNEMVEAMAGKAAWPGGKLRVRAGVYSAPVATITEDWLSGADAIQIVPEASMDDAINIYRPTIANGKPVTAGDASGYVTSTAYAAGATEITLSWGTGTIPAGEFVSFGSDPTYYPLENGVAAPGEHLTLASPGLLYAVPSGATVNLLGDLKTAYVAAPTADVRAEAYVTLDGRELAQETTLSAVTDVWHAQHICGVLLRDSRNGLAVTLPCNMRAFQLEMFDVVNVTLPRFGWTNKTFEVLGWQFSLTGGVTISLKETTASIFQVDAGFSLIDLTPNTDLPSPFNVPQVTGLAASSGTNQLLIQSDGTILTRILVTWDAIEDEAVRSSTRGGIVVRYWLATQDQSTSQSVTVEGDATSVYLDSVIDGQFYMITALAQNSLVRGVECQPIMHYVVGKTEPPPDVDAFTVFEQTDGTRQYFWSYPDDVYDLAGFTAKYAPALGSTDWAGMIPLFQASRSERIKESMEPADGEYTMAIKAVDTSGNESTNAYYINVLLDVSGAGTSLYMRRPHDLGWPGIKVDCFVDGYILDSASLLTWDTIPSTWDSWRSWRGPSKSPIQYIDETLDIGSVLNARLRCAAWVQGTVVAEYQGSTDGSIWTGWAEVPVEAVSVRYLRVRWTVSGTDPQLYRAQIALYT